MNLALLANTLQKELKTVSGDFTLCYNCCNNPNNSFNLSESAEEVYKIQEDFQFPTASDADDALTGLLRMQYMYDLKADDVMKFCYVL